MEKIKYSKIIYFLIIILIIYFLFLKQNKLFVSKENQPAIAKQTSINPIENNQTRTVRDQNKIINSDSDSSIKTQFNTPHDLFYLAQTLLDKARAGDAESQYYLSKILQYCWQATEQNIEYVLNDIYQKQGVNPNLNHIKAIEHKVTRCSGFDRDNFNYFKSEDKTGWLEKSARSGFVLAMSEYAKNTLEDSTNGASSAESLSTYKEASNMLFQSIEQGGGEVYFNVAQISITRLTS